MELLKELITAVQWIIPIAAAIKILKLVGEHAVDEDKSIRNKRIRNVIIITIACETVIYLGTVIRSYYT